MRITIAKTAEDLGRYAATEAAKHINKAIEINGRARIILSTGASQFDTMKNLVLQDVDWSRVEMFHLDEYMDLPITHAASFRKYLRERFVEPTGVEKVYFVDGSREGIKWLSQEIDKAPIDVGLIGIGQNGHIAFNDPPADFDTRESFIIVNLDEACRNQQVSEGWFATMSDVPKQAVTMTVWQIMQCRHIISAVPHAEKAEAIARMLVEPLTPKLPATMLKTHESFDLFVDANSYAKVKRIVALKGETIIVDRR